MEKTADNYVFLKNWRKHQADTLMEMFPQLEKKEVKGFLDNVIKDHVKDRPAVFHNNYEGREREVSLLNVINWFEKVKPIAGGFGVFYNNQEVALNPNGVMLITFLNNRKEIKKGLKNHKKGSYEYMMIDLDQGNEKVNANAFYGAGGARTFVFYNVYTATSITATGQSLISTTEQAFEMFLSNSVKFIDLDDCMHFLENIRKEKRRLKANFLPNVSIELLMNRLKGMFHDFKDEYDDLLFMYLMNQDQETLNRMFFKNNLFEFSFTKKIRNWLSDIVHNVDTFTNPNEVPKSIEKSLAELWDYYSEFVFYNYPTFNRIHRMKTEERDSVVVVDTDSNMLNLHPWVVFMQNVIVSVDDELIDRDPEQMRYININIMCYFISRMIGDVLEKYTKTANIPKVYRGRINMKNEFMFPRLILATKKKRYAASLKLREGEELPPGEIEIKGHDFIKSGTREETKVHLERILRDRLLETKNIDAAAILRDLEEFEGIIRRSLMNGEKNFIIPSSPKAIEAYKEPFSEQGVRGVYAWNYLYPEMTIGLPEKVDLVKVNLGSEKELELLKETEPKKYEILKKKVFGNREKTIAKHGVKVIALPKTVKAIPDWMVPFIDVDTIVTDNLGRFSSVLESLEIEIVRSSKRDYFSNILRV